MVLGPLSDQTLERFRMYATRIKVLDGGIMPKKFEIEPYTWTYLAALSGGSLLPSLRRLRVCANESTEIEALFALRSDSLTTLALDIDEDYEKQKVSLLHVLCKSSSLYSARISGCLSKDLMTCLSGCHTLRQIELRLIVKEGMPFGSELLMPVCDLLALEEIAIADRCAYHSTKKELQAGKLLFKTLRKLSILALPISILSILLSLRAPSLENLQITLMDRHGEGRVEVHHMLLVLSKIVLGLQNFHFRVGWNTLNQRIALPKNFFRSLLSPNGPQEFQVSDFVVSFGDDDIQLLPRLEWLRVLRIRTNYFKNPLTLSSLRTLAEKCPSLQVVEFTFNICKKDIDALLDEVSRCPSTDHGLKKVIIGMAGLERMSDAYRLGVLVSQYLDHFFPSLVSVEAGICGDAEWCSGINACLTAYRQVRAKLNNCRG